MIKIQMSDFKKFILEETVRLRKEIFLATKVVRTIQLLTRQEVNPLLKQKAIVLPYPIDGMVISVAEGLRQEPNIYRLVYGVAKRLGISPDEVRPHFWQVVAAARLISGMEK